MASVGNIFGTIRMKTSGLKRDLNSATKDIKGFSGKMEGSFRRLGTSLRGAFNPVTLGLVGLTAAIGASVFAVVKGTQEFVKFEDALLDLQKVLSDTEGNAKDFIGVTEGLSSKFGEATSDVLQSAANFKQAGFGVKEAFKLVESSLTLVKIGELEAAEASELLISILKGFKAPASEAGRVLDILNEVSNKYATSLKELGRGMAIISPIAKLMGFSFEETAGLLTPIIEVFRSGSEAGNALKIGLLRLIDDNKQVIDALDAIGISQNKANGELKSGKEILIEVQKAFTTLDPAMKVFIASQLAGARQAGRLLEVFNGLEKTTKVTKDAINSFGSSNKELDVRLGALSQQLKTVKIKFNDLFREIGSYLAPQIRKTAKLTIAFMDSFKSGGRLEAFTLLLKGIVRGLTGVAKAFLAIVDAYNAVSDFTDKMVKSGTSQPNRRLGTPTPKSTSASDASPFAMSHKSLSNTQVQETLDNMMMKSTLESLNKIKAANAEVANEKVAQLKKITEAYKSLDIESSTQANKAAIVIMDSFKVIEEAMIESPERLKEIWRTISSSIEVSALDTESKKTFDALQKRMGKTAEEFKKMTNEGIKVRESVRTFVEVLSEEQVRLKELFDAGVIGQQTFDRAIIESEIKFADASGKMKKTSTDTFDDMKSAVEGWASGFSQTLTDVLFGAETTFEGILKSFAKMITQMIIQITIIEPLIKGILNFGFSNTNSLGQTTHRQLGMETVTTLGEGFFGVGLPQNAKGGVATKPTAGVFGEAGTEALIPLDRFPEFQGSGGNTNVEVNVIGVPEGTKTEESTTSGGMRKIDVILDEKVANNIRSGSKTFTAMTKAFSNLSPQLAGR